MKKLRASTIILRTHQWLGSLMCGPTLIWFFSGIVMTFAGFPRLDTEERLGLLPPLVVTSARSCFEANDPRFHGAEIVQRAEGELCLSTQGGRRKAHWLEDGRPYASLSDRETVEQAARAVGLPSEVDRSGDGDIFVHQAVLSRADQWTLSAHYAAHRPLHRISREDRAQTVLYVGERTGEVVQLTTGKDRLLAWLGAIPHWIYLTALRRATETWRYLVIVLSLIALVMTVSGLIFGLTLQVRRWKKHRRLDTPFSRDVYRWHHYLGLGSGVFTSSWLLSGAMSLNPLDWSPGSAPGPTRAGEFAGAPKAVEATPMSIVARRCQMEDSLRLLRSFHVGGDPYYLCFGVGGDTRIVSGSGDWANEHFSREALERYFQQAFPNLRIARADWLLMSDDYYYSTHFRPDRARFPCLRMEIEDEERSLVYIDARRGQIALWHTRRSRAERWLYHGLHSLDFAWLYRHPWAWFTTVLSLLVLGILSSGSGVLLGWRFASRGLTGFLRRRSRRPRHL